MSEIVDKVSGLQIINLYFHQGLSVRYELMLDYCTSLEQSFIQMIQDF